MPIPRMRLSIYWDFAAGGTAVDVMGLTYIEGWLRSPAGRRCYKPAINQQGGNGVKL